MTTARVIGDGTFLLRFAARLNPCRWCGEKAEIQRQLCDWGFREVIRATCSDAHDPIYVSGIYRDERYFHGLYSALEMLLNLWNEHHDGPGFFAGLA